MNKFVIDAYAWIEYLDGTLIGEEVKKILENQENDNYTCAVTVAEIVSKFIRMNKDPNIALKAIRTLSKIINIDVDLSDSTGRVHAEMKRKIKDFGLSDAYILVVARKLNAKILTGDIHFKNLKEAVFL